MKNQTTLVFLLFISSIGFSQKKEVLQNIDVANTKAVFLGKTERVDDLVPRRHTNLDKRMVQRRNKQLPPNFEGRGKSKVTIPALEHQGIDPIRQTKFSRRSGVAIEPIVNEDGLFNSFGSPQDPSGDIGSNYYVQAINATDIGVYNKDGSLESSFAANTLWTPLGETSLGDPIVLYDQELDRWVLTEFANPALLLIAVSETNDPLGSYFVYSFATPNFPDYPKYAIWTKSIVVTTNESGPGQLHQYFIDREALMAGEENVTIQRVQINGNSSTEAGFYVTTPANWLGSQAPVDDNPVAMKINDSSWGEVAEDMVELFTFEIDFADESNSTVTKTEIITTPFDAYPCSESGSGFQCVPQKDGGGLDAIPEVIMNIPHYRNFGDYESIVLNFITDVTDGENLSGIRWMELRRISGEDWSLYQEGTFAPDDGLDRYMGSIAMDGNGNIGLAYNVSSEEEYVGIRFTGRFAGDALGEMTVEEYEVVAGTNVITSGGRFGDYAHMSVDPIDDATFWYTSEYAGNSPSNSKTRILSFLLQRNDNDLAAGEISSPNTSSSLTATEAVTVEVLNVGNLAATDFDLLLYLNEELVETYAHSEELAAEATLEHTFTTTVDLSALGDYELRLEVEYANDEAVANNTTSKTVTQLATIDASLSLEDADASCSEELTSIVVVENNGTEDLTSADIEVYVNEALQETVNWTGQLALGESEEVAVTFTNLIGGENVLRVGILNVNGGSDEVPNNNEAEISVSNSLTLQQLTLELLTDNYPGETTWHIETLEGEVLYEGGPYTSSGTTFTETFCLETDACYAFRIFDSFEDGICCAEGNGSYSLTGPEGEVIVENGGEFTAFEAIPICFGEGIFPQNDIAVEFSPTFDNTVCSDELKASLSISNMGQLSLTSAVLELSVGDVLVETVNWAGSLAFGEVESVDVVFPVEDNGLTTLSVTASSPNGETDSNAGDNFASTEADVDKTLEQITLQLTTDDFPLETTWEITNAEDEVIFSGGPYTQQATLIEEVFCMDDTECFNFTIFDAEADGICCGFGNGSYTILSSSGAAIISSTGQFTSSESLEFCAEFLCALNVTVDVNSVEGNDLGLILIQATGASDAMFSIDGGETFSSNFLFEDLEVGNYDIVVTSNDGLCLHEETVTVDRILGAEDDLIPGLSVGPNPTNGVFNLKLSGHEYIDGFLVVDVLDLNGRIVQERKISRYGNEFQGAISLYAYPDGIYFIKLVNAQGNRLVRIIKK